MPSRERSGKPQFFNANPGGAMAGWGKTRVARSVSERKRNCSNKKEATEHWGSRAKPRGQHCGATVPC